MANLNATNAAGVASVPQARVKTNAFGGRLRFFESTAVVPAAGGPIVGEQIVWGALPVGARIVAHLSHLAVSAGAASSTVNLGDSVTPARHLAATGVTSAGVTALTTPASGAASFETSDASGTATDNSTLRSTVAGAALQAGQVLTLRVAYVTD